MSPGLMEIWGRNGERKQESKELSCSRTDSRRSGKDMTPIAKTSSHQKRRTDKDARLPRLGPHTGKAIGAMVPEQACGFLSDDMIRVLEQRSVHARESSILYEALGSTRVFRI